MNDDLRMMITLSQELFKAKVRPLTLYGFCSDFEGP